MSSTVFVGGDIVIDGQLQRADVLVAEGRIVGVSAPTGATNSADQIVDCAGAVIAPGYIDLQCNGAGGVDLTSEPGRLVDVARVLPRFGVTSFLPTVVTAPEPTRSAALDALRAVRAADRRAGDGASLLGLHFEGPAISPDHLGAHRRSYVAVPSTAEIDDWIESGAVALVTVAPEVDGAGDVIEQLASAGIVVSAGHTAMSPEEFAVSRRLGVRYVTHLFNAMAPFDHRAPGPIGATLADDDVTVGLICDGIHVDPVAVRVAWHALGPRRLSLVSDASAPLGAPFGTFRLGTYDVVYDESGVRTPDGVLAGSALGLDQAVRNLVEFTGCDLADAVATVTTTPADLLGVTDRGRIREGNHADFTIIDRDGGLIATIVAGSTEWQA